MADNAGTRAMNRGKAEASAVRRAQCVGLRLQGFTYARIGARLGIAESTAHEHVRRAMLALAAETNAEAEQLRALESARLDAAQVAIWDRAMQGDLAAVDTFVKLSARRCALWGLDVQPGVRGDAAADFAALVAGIRERLAVAMAGTCTEDQIAAVLCQLPAVGDSWAADGGGRDEMECDR